MTFLSPALLWSLVVLVPLAAVYFLKVRPRKTPTTAYFLWEQIFQEKRASSLFHRLRDAMSLLLMALAAAAVCFALARPEWADERKDLLIVIDDSASMSASEGSNSRLEMAKQTASQIVQGLNGNQRAAIATIAQRLHYRSHLTDNPRELLQAIDAIEPTVDTLDLAELPTGNWNAEVSAGQGDGAGQEAAAASVAAKNGKVVAAPNEHSDGTLSKSSASTHRVLFVSDGGFDAKKFPPMSS